MAQENSTQRYDKGFMSVNLSAAVLTTTFIPGPNGDKKKDKLRLFVKKSTEEVSGTTRTEVSAVAVNLTLTGFLARQAKDLQPGDSITVQNASVFQTTPRNDTEKAMLMFVANYNEGARITLDKRMQHKTGTSAQPAQQPAPQPQQQAAPQPAPQQAAPQPAPDFDSFDDDIPF